MPRKSAKLDGGQSLAWGEPSNTRARSALGLEERHNALLYGVYLILV
jgi:hypothetical protein